jgi:hypothetical protein
MAKADPPPIHFPGQTKIIIIDSVAFHFRHDFDDMALRTRLLAGMAQECMQLATSHELAVGYALATRLAGLRAPLLVCSVIALCCCKVRAAKGELFGPLILFSMLPCLPKVVMMNQMTTKVDGDGQSRLVPALGGCSFRSNLRPAFPPLRAEQLSSRTAWG